MSKLNPMNYDGGNRKLKPEVFDNPTSRSKTKYVSISPKGTIIFSQGSVMDFNIHKANFVRLAYDAQEKAICLKFLEHPALGSCKITKPKLGSVRINRRQFFDHYDIVPTEVTRYFATKENIEGSGEWLVIYLDNPIQSSINKVR